MENLERDFKGIEETYGQNVLHLTPARGYVKKLPENAGVESPTSFETSEISLKRASAYSFEASTMKALHKSSRRFSL